MEAFLADLGKQGILGLMLAISLTMNFTLVKMLLAEKDKRIQDATQVTSNIAAPLANIKDAIDLLQEKVTISKRTGR